MFVLLFAVCPKAYTQTPDSIWVYPTARHTISATPTNDRYKPITNYVPITLDSSLNAIFEEFQVDFYASIRIGLYTPTNAYIISNAEDGPHIRELVDRLLKCHYFDTICTDIDILPPPAKDTSVLWTDPENYCWFIYGYSVPKYPKANISVSPTCFDNHFKVTVDRASMLYLYDLTGKLLLEKALQAGDNRIEPNLAMQGMYIVSVRNKKQSKNFKMIKL